MRSVALGVAALVLVVAAIVLVAPNPSPRILASHSGPICGGPMGPDGNPTAAWNGSTQQCEVPASPRVVVALDRSGHGPLEWTQDVSAAAYAVQWSVTAGVTACHVRLTLDGPTGWDVIDDSGRAAPTMGSGPVVLNPTTEVPAGQRSAGAMRTMGGGVPTTIPLEAGTSTLRLDTDCPGDSSLTVFRYSSPS